jgi:hypothetical protein
MLYSLFYNEGRYSVWISLVANLMREKSIDYYPFISAEGVIAKASPYIREKADILIYWNQSYLQPQGIEFLF